jgi:hypothetical protein
VGSKDKTGSITGRGEKQVSTHEFYSIDNHHNERQIRILSVGSLVSKPPTKEKRISIKVRMPLSGTVNMGAPEWLDNAYVFVAKNHDTVTPNIEFKGYSIDFSVENLFGEPIASKDCIMRAFEVAEFGDEENPDVALSFTIRMPFSGKRWEWLGNFVGEDVWAKFIPGEAGIAGQEEEDGTELDDGENDDQPGLGPDNEFDPVLDKPIELEYDSGPKLVKSGPDSLAAFHEGVVAQEVKRGRGRPKKVVDPLTVQAF